MGKASRRKYVQRAGFITLTTDPERITRQLWKAHNLAAHYGAASINWRTLHNIAVQDIEDSMDTKHPLQHLPDFQLITLADKRFGHVPVYKTSTKMIGRLTSVAALGPAAPMRVPETEVWCRDVGNQLWHPHREGVTAIAWFKGHRLADIQTAVAFLLMQDKIPVVVRAFGPRPGGKQP